MDSEFPVWLERALITFAFCMSFALALATGLQRWLNRHLNFEIALLGVTSLGCILSGLSGLILFLTGRMSLDAFGVVLIGLLPALEVAGRVRIGELFARVSMRERPALHNRIADVEYVRHGKPPRPGQLGEHVCDTDTYLRTPASSRKEPKENYTYEFWHGQVLDFNSRLIFLKDYNDVGDAVRWWKAANEAVDVVRDPSTARMPKKHQATSALELIAEIAMIGDSVLHYFDEPLRKYAEDAEKIKTAISASPASVCIAVFESVGLSAEWGPITEDLREDFVRRVDTLNRAKKYGMLFFMLLTVSDLFQGFGKKRNGSACFDAAKVIATFKENQDPSDRKKVIGHWLARYGLTKKRFDKCTDADVEDDGIARKLEPTHSYALIPLHDDAHIPRQTMDFTIDFDKLSSPEQVQIHANDISRSAKPPQDQVSRHVPDLLSGRLRFVVPITRPHSTHRLHDCNGGTSGPPPIETCANADRSREHRPYPPSLEDGDPGRTHSVALTGNQRDSSTPVPVHVAIPSDKVVSHDRTE